MKQYCLKISSRNKKSLKGFLNFFSDHLRTKFNNVEKSNRIYNKKKIVTLLKSPHVNKTAQEKFEYRVFTSKILVMSSSLNKNFIFTKKILTNLFQDVFIKIELINNFILNDPNYPSTLYPDNFKLFKHKQALFKDNIRRRKKKRNKKNVTIKNSSLTKFSHFLFIISGFGESLTFQISNK